MFADVSKASPEQATSKDSKNPSPAGVDLDAAMARQQRANPSVVFLKDRRSAMVPSSEARSVEPTMSTLDARLSALVESPGLPFRVRLVHL